MEIERKLVHIDRDGEWNLVDPVDRLRSSLDPVVILGDPGVGKTTLLRRLGQRSGMTYIRAADLMRAEDPASLFSEDDRVVVDGLDEVATPGTGSALAAVLRQLREAKSMPPVLACRTAEWRGEADFARIGDTYANPPTVLYLTQFNDDEARAFLAEEYPGVQVLELLRHLKNPELSHVRGNPLILRLFAEAIRGGRGLPETRAALLERAGRAMAGQDNRSPVVRLVCAEEDDLLLASGAICATMLLCDLAGVHDGEPAETPAGFANVADIEGLPFGGAAAEALATRLFRADGEGRFSCFHRALAEYLGARWLVRCVDEGIWEERVHGLFGRGVPTALRGLHAWMARLGPALADRCIAADPYAVLRDGETATLDLGRARALLAALKERSGEDPRFDSGDWGLHPAAGLIRTELKDDVLEILASPGPHAQLSACLAEAMSGTDLSVEAGWTLKGILFDRSRSYSERAMAFRSLWLAGICEGEAAALRLLDLGDAASARLACEAVEAAASDVVRPMRAAPAGGAKLRLVAPARTEQRARPAMVAGAGLFGALDTAGLAAALDGLAPGAPAMMVEADVPERSTFTDTVRHLAARVLEADATVAPRRVWAWIGWTREADGCESSRERLAAVFRKEPALRAGLMEHVLLTPRLGGAGTGSRELEATGLGLDPDVEDVSGVLASLHARPANDTADPDLHGQLLALRDAARAAADPTYEFPPPIGMPGSRGREEDRDDAARVAGLADRRSLRDSLSGRADRIAVGDVRLLAVPAAVYLGREDALDEPIVRDASAAPEERLREVLGEELTELVLAGFVAVLGRGDLPRAEEIARIHCTGGEHEAEAPMISGVSVALDRDLSLDTVGRATLDAVYLAWLRAPKDPFDRRFDGMESALEEMVFTGAEAIERLFRASIEPQLACNLDFVRDLDRMAEYYRFGGPGCRLPVEWLRKYPELKGKTQAELITCVLESAPREALRDLIVEGRETMPRDDRARQLWLAAACLVDLDGSREKLLAEADDPDFLGHVQEAIEGLNRFAEAPLESLVFVVQIFGVRWPRTPTRPGDEGRSLGWRDPRNASAFIERTIHAIANRPEPEATEALRNLIEDHAPSYADTARRALAFQRTARRDCEQAIPTVAGLHALMKTEPAAAEHGDGNSGSDDDDGRARDGSPVRPSGPDGRHP